jgi:hypothetical protein
LWDKQNHEASPENTKDTIQKKMFLKILLQICVFVFQQKKSQPFLGCRGEKNCFCVFSILMFGKKAVCPDGLFVPAVFQESDFYLNSLSHVGSVEREKDIARKQSRQCFAPPHHLPALIYGFSGGKKNIKFYFWTKRHTRKNSSVS